MAKISELTAAGALDGNEEVPIVKGGATRKTTLGTLMASVAQPFVTLSQAAATTAANLVGTINPADILDMDAALLMAKAPGWRSSAGRLKRVGQCAWTKISANEARIYVNNSGVVEGVLHEGAETITGADFYTAPANSGSPQYGILNLGTGATVAQVGGHTSPDISGGTGKGIRVYGGTGATTELRLTNYAAALTTGQSLLVMLWVSFDNPVSQLSSQFFGRTASTSAGNNGFTINTDGSLTLTPSAIQGIDLFDTAADGRKWYRMWRLYTAPTTGTYYPSIQVPAGCYMNLAAANLIVNRQQAIPTLMPVMGSGNFIDDGIQLATTTPLEVEWKNLRVGRTSISDGLLVPPRNLATPILPIARKITVKRATELTSRAYALPGPNMGKLFVSGQADYLGPGFWGVIGNNAAGSFNLRGAYSDPKRWPLLRKYRMSNAGLTTLNIDRVAFWLRTPADTTTGGTAASQPVLSIEVDPAKVTIGDVFLAGAASNWSQYIAPAGSEVIPSPWGENVGRFYVTGGGATGTLTIGRMKIVKASYGLATTVPTGFAVTINATGFASDKINADHVQLTGLGTTNLNFGHHAFGNFEAASLNFWQIPYEIEVDTGSGWQVLSASGLTVSQLPTWKRFSWYGTHVSGTITATPKPERQLWISSWLYNSGLGATVDKPGFQYRGPNMLYRDAITGAEMYRTTAMPDGTVWISDDVGTPTATNPRIRIRHTSVKWTSSTVNVPQSGTLSAGAGTHGDNLQIVNAGTWSYNCQNVVMLGTDAQGFFAGGGNCTAFSARGLFAISSVNAVSIAGSGSYMIAGLMFSPFSLDRDSSGKQYGPRIDVPAGTTLNLGGLYVSTNADFPSPMRTVTGTLASSPIPVATARVNGTLIPALTDQPGAANYLEYFISPTSLKDGKVNATPSNLLLAGYAFDRAPYLNDILNTVRAGAWGMFSELEALCTLGPPTHWTTISYSAAIGTALTLTVRDQAGSTTLKGKLIVEGDPLEQFTIENGVLKTAALIRDAFGVAVVDNLALVTDAGERISVKVTA